jgi:putative methyltransferase (TIGR04325 family)
MIKSLLKKSIKKYLPVYIRSKLSGIYYGWHGNYPSWEDARRRCTGYDSSAILEKVKNSVLQVKEGKAAFERDSVLFYDTDYSFPLLSSLTWIAAKNRGRLNIIDFGGSLGSTYYQNRSFLSEIPDVNWCVVEQKEFVDTGKRLFEDENLHFFYSIEECMKSNKIDAILFSSVLQYLEKPYEVIDEVISAGIRFLIIDRTPFIKGKGRITIQRVNPSIYRASYPCWFFNKNDFLERLTHHFRLILEFDALDRANIKSEFRGFLMERIKQTPKPPKGDFPPLEDTLI